MKNIGTTKTITTKSNNILNLKNSSTSSEIRDIEITSFNYELSNFELTTWEGEFVDITLFRENIVEVIKDNEEALKTLVTANQNIVEQVENVGELTVEVSKTVNSLIRQNSCNMTDIITKFYKNNLELLKITQKLQKTHVETNNNLITVIENLISTPIGMLVTSGSLLILTYLFLKNNTRLFEIIKEKIINSTNHVQNQINEPINLGYNGVLFNKSINVATAIGFGFAALKILFKK